jgi:hypothetical protein
MDISTTSYDMTGRDKTEDRTRQARKGRGLNLASPMIYMTFNNNENTDNIDYIVVVGIDD